MAINKIQIDGNTLIDLSSDTAVETDVAQGKTFHKADGTIATGTASGGSGSTDGVITPVSISSTITMMEVIE